MVSEECKILYGKLNSFVTKVINRDVPSKVYPIGSIYMSVNSTNPSELFGGEWERIQDTFLLASGTSYANGSTGGSANAVVVKHNHTQNAHTHNGASGRAFVTDIEGTGINESRFTAVSSGSTYTVRFASGDNWWGVNNVGNTTATNQEKGVDGTGKNMPPYLAVYVWKRIA